VTGKIPVTGQIPVTGFLRESGSALIYREILGRGRIRRGTTENTREIMGLMGEMG